ncbi:MAG: U32 family peptidase [Bacteroidales bacterium]|nr:U32 family peptidase [Bacteroidales bacterium]
MKSLELLAPARNTDIGIAAIDCGADAVYIAGPSFGARKDAGNPVSEIARLCAYAHKFGCRIFVTFNILLRDGEMDEVHRQMLAAQEAGADAFIIRDPRIGLWDDIRVPLHASTQCAIRSVERARLFAQAGCSRLILERELPLSVIGEIASAVPCEIECFVHGALCVCYSGQCTMSEVLTGGRPDGSLCSGASLPGGVRSGDRGDCIQACRNLYDLEDASGRVLVRNKALLSLRDLNLSARLADLVSAGVTSFKIEGRLKNASFVRNTVRHYSLLLDQLVAGSGGSLRRASFGRVDSGFTPDLSKTFNRGFTELFLDGKRGSWSSMDAPKSMGEEIGVVQSVRAVPQGVEVIVSPFGTPEGALVYETPSEKHLVHQKAVSCTKPLDLHNGDGFAFVLDGEIIGFRGDVCQGNRIICKPVAGLKPGVVLWRNVSQAFEKSLDANPCKRYIGVSLNVKATEPAQEAHPSSSTNPGGITLHVTATTEDGRHASVSVSDCEPARDIERAEAMISGQLGKRVDHYSFSVASLAHSGSLPHLSAAALNGLRRDLAAQLDSDPVYAIPLAGSGVDVANSRPASSPASARVIAPETLDTGRRPGELMRTKYCIRYELGLCPVHQKDAKRSASDGQDSLPAALASIKTSNLNGLRPGDRLYLVNNGRRFPLLFDCASCEMAVLDSVAHN